MHYTQYRYINVLLSNLILGQIVGFLRGKNDFTEISKILLDTDENNFVGILKIMNNATNNFDILSTSSSVLHN